MRTVNLPRLVAAALAAVFPNAALADELSLSEAIHKAIANNPTVGGARHAADAARLLARGAGKLRNPETTLSPTVVGSSGSDSAILFAQPLELNGARAVRAAVAESRARLVAFETHAVLREVVLRVKQAYWDVARAQELVKLSEHNLEYLRALGAAVQKQYDLGTVPGSQVLKTELEIARAKQELAQARLELADTKAVLATLMNRHEGGDFAVSNPPVPAADLPPIEELQQAALARRPEMLAAEASAAAAVHEVRAVRLEGLPDIALQARMGSLKSGGDAGVAIAITLPFMDWGARKAQERSAQSALQAGQRRLEATANDIRLDVVRAHLAVTTLSRVVHDYESGILKQSEELASMAETGYSKGATSYLEVLEAQRTLRGTRAVYVAALADHAKALARLEWAVGLDETEVSK
ncbi:MAG: hypothetical protein AMXMBFR61_19700 [Fimbriimonadales bacterium]